jgi:hypothetical protein
VPADFFAQAPPMPWAGGVPLIAVLPAVRGLLCGDAVPHDGVGVGSDAAVAFAGDGDGQRDLLVFLTSTAPSARAASCNCLSPSSMAPRTHRESRAAAREWARAGPRAQRIRGSSLHPAGLEDSVLLPGRRRCDPSASPRGPPGRVSALPLITLRGIDGNVPGCTRYREPSRCQVPVAAVPSLGPGCCREPRMRVRTCASWC